jgi:hypothetical protein
VCRSETDAEEIGIKTSGPILMTFAWVSLLVKPLGLACGTTSYLNVLSQYIAALRFF